MSAENKTVIRRWFDEVWNQGRVESIDELLAADGVVHGLGDGSMTGPAAFRAFQASYKEALPDVAITIEDLVAEGDMVAFRWSATGTHRGSGMGIAPTDRAVRFSGMGFGRVKHGQIVEGWNNFDHLGLLQQLGAVTMPR